MKQLIKTAVIAFAVLAAACGESALGPRSLAIRAPTFSKGGWKQPLSTNAVQFSFVIDPSKDTKAELGAGNEVLLPAHSVCDPTKTSYGPGTWDLPCEPAFAPITVTVSAWTDAKGHPQVNFSPDLRFVPTTDPNAMDHIEFSDAVAASNPAFNILYCRPRNPNAKPDCIDEALTDPTLVTVRDPATGRLERRIKHFSGYNVAAGADSTGTVMMSRVGQYGASFSAVPAGPQSVAPVYRNHPLPDHPTRSADIGPAGGQLSLPQAGLTLVVPAGAVSSLTHFSVTSVSGRFVAYDFEPHGMHFAVPLEIQQDLRDVGHRPGDVLVGGYFANDSQLDESRGTALVDETLATQLDVSRNQASFPVRHFSGYMLASGRGG